MPKQGLATGRQLEHPATDDPGSVTGPGGAKMMTLNPERLRSLSELPLPLLTAYLNTKPAEPSHHGLVPPHLTWLNKEAKSIARSVLPTERELFREHFGRLEGFLRDRTSQERGLVVFAGPETWELVPLQWEVENELHWGRPGLAQLLRLLREHRPYCIVVVDRHGARFFRYWLGEMAELEEKKFRIDISQWKKKELGHVVGQGVEKTRGSQRDTFEHRMDAQYARLCRETAEQAKSLCARQGLTAIFLVGSDRLVEPIEAAFPRGFRTSIVLIREDFGRLFSPALRQRLNTRIAAWEAEHKVGGWLRQPKQAGLSRAATQAR